MASNFNIQNLHLLNVQVSNYPFFPMSFMSNFISGSRNLPNCKTSITTSLPMNKLHCLSSSLSSSEAAEAPVSVSTPNDHSFVVSYLINSCGLPPELALSRTSQVKFGIPGKPEIVLAFFKKHGFTESQVSSMVAKFPGLLAYNPESTLLPKLEFLSSLGLSSREITGVISSSPYILKRSLEKAIIPCYNLLRNLVQSDDESIALVKRYPTVLSIEFKVDNVQILQEVGVPPENILAFMKHRHGVYMFATNSTNSSRKAVEEVKEMGFDPLSMNFLWAVAAMRLSTWENKVQLFRKYGWSDQMVLVAFEKWPKFIITSEDKLKEVMDFLVNQMGMEAATIANYPRIFSMSLKKRIVPRWLIYQVLLEKGLFEERSIIALLFITEKLFLKRYIKRYEEEAPELLALYQK